MTLKCTRIFPADGVYVSEHQTINYPYSAGLHFRVSARISMQESDIKLSAHILSGFSVGGKKRQCARMIRNISKLSLGRLTGLYNLI